MNMIENRITVKIEKSKLMLKALLIIVFMLIGYSSWGQPVIDATSAGYVNTNVTTITVSHTTGSGSNRLMLVGVSYREGGTVSATYDGDPLELVGSQTSSNNAKTYIFSMINPPTGTADIVITNTGGNFDKGGIVGAITFSGVDINNPLNTFTSTQTNTQNPILSNIPTATNQIVFSVISQRNTNLTAVGAGQISPGSAPWSQTLPVINNSGAWYINSGDEIRGGGSTKVGDGATTSISWTSGDNQDWSMSAVSIRPTPVADLSIVKTSNNLTPYKGQQITFTLTANNSSGSETSVNTVVDDLLPDGFTYVSHSTATGTYNAGSGVWEIGTLAGNATATLTIIAFVNNSGTYINTATITGDVIDNIPGNNTSSVTIIPCNAGGTAPLFNN